ncbi:Golgi integral membrane protein 4-like [Planococcus citri]|uniref:Golgi integral membrane protein 4-like n=1 Tax=Planococcus citri TaxID=170843 RepID=UPI0031F93C8E
MVLRSPLRMNKNIVFPFISCIMIMLTLLVLIHKSADELTAAKKEISQCKQQYDSLYTQLQNAIEYKLRLEKTLQNEKADNKQKIEDVQVILSQEKEERRKEKEEAENRYDALNQKYRFKESENKDFNDNVQSLQKQILEKDEQISTLTKQLSSLRAEKEQLVSQKDEQIHDLEMKLKKYDKDAVVAPPKKMTPETIDSVPGIQQPDGVQPQNPNATTPKIDPLALQGAAEDEQNQKVAPPPPPPPQQEEQENSLQKQMRKDLNAALSNERKPEESVINAPDKKDDDAKLSANAENSKNAANMVLPMPNMDQINKKPQPSVASNNVGELPQIEERQKNIPPPNQNAVEKILPKQMKDYNADYNKDTFGEEDGEEGEYMDNDVGKGQVIPRKDFKHFEENMNEGGGESVVIHPK